MDRKFHEANAAGGNGEEERRKRLLKAEEIEMEVSNGKAERREQQEEV